jgi:flagellar protein FlaF
LKSQPTKSTRPKTFFHQEAIIRNAASHYQRASEAAINGHETERAAFRMIIRDLETCTPGQSRVRALGRNHQLWSILVQDLSVAENRMPEGIKAQLINLGLWSMRYSTLALLKDLPVQPLIEVNRNVADGLNAQGTAPTPTVLPQPSEQVWKAPLRA